MIENEEQASNHGASQTAGDAAIPSGAITTAQLAKTILESTLLQAKFNQSILARLDDLANGVLQTHEILQRVFQHLNEQIGKLKAGSYAWARFGAPVGDGLLVTKVLNTFLMYMEASDMSVTPHLIADGCWEKTITDAIVARLKPGMTVIDVGANYGYYTLLSACCVGDKGRVYSFEPNPRTFQILKKNIEVNWLRPIVRPFQMVALDSRKKVELHVLRDFQGCTSLFSAQYLPEPDTPPDQRPLVDAVPLDEIIQDEKIDLVKIDAEGSEPLVLDGMQQILARNPELTLLVEINVPMIRNCGDPADFLDRVRKLGGTMQYFTPWNTLEPFNQEKALQFPLFNLLIERKPGEAGK